MPKILRWLCLLLLPFATLGQAVPKFKLTNVLGTPLYSPWDIGVDARGFMYVLEDDPYFSGRRGMVTKLDAQGRFVARLDVSKPNYTRPYGCEGSALALDATGNLYLVDTGAGEVRKFSPTGQLLRTFTDAHWQTCSLYNPTNLTVDGAGNVYVVDDRRVQKFDAQGAWQWAYEPALTPRPGRPDVRLLDVATDAAGNVYVVNSESLLAKLNASGQLQQSFLVNKAGGYYLTGSSISSLVLDAAGNLYIGVSGGSPVYKFDAAGNFLLSIGPDISWGRLALTFDASGKLYAVAGGNRGYGAMIHKFEPTGPRLALWGEMAEYLFITQAGGGDYFVYNWSRQQVVKRSADGKELLRFGGTGGMEGTFDTNNGMGDRVVGLALDAQGNVYTAENSSYSGPRVQKFSSQGKFLKAIYSPAFQGGARLAGISVDPAGAIYLPDITSNQVLKINQQGQLLLRFGKAGPGLSEFRKPQAVATDDLGFVYVADSTGIRIRQFSPTGQYVRQTLIAERLGTYSYAIGPTALSVDQQGDLFVSNTGWDSVHVVGRNGRFHQALAPEFGEISGLSTNREGTRLLTLHSAPEVVCAYTTGAALAAPQGHLRGRLYQDLNQDCQPQAAEPGLAGLVVVAEPGQFYGLSDENGNYSIAADTGTYTVRQLLPRELGRTIQPSCAATRPAQLTSANLTSTSLDFGDHVAAMPYLTVSVASNRRRRCFRNVTTVAYANTGFAAAANAKVVVEFPEHVLLVGANAPYVRDAKGNYVFSVGALAPDQRGTITIYDSVACGNAAIRGLTVCTKAWITPANTYPVPSTWNEASIAVKGTPQPDNQVRFTVTNTGRKATTDSLSLRVYQDTNLALVHRFALAATDSLVLRVPATGQVVRVEADQPLGHPVKVMASANVELAGRATGAPSAAMAAFPPDSEPEKAVDCQPILDSYDPNDKQVLPAGLTAAHYTPTNTPLHYQIRFQNTGNDVAYRVEVVDTLAADLDISTLQIGAVSHPYRLTVTGKARPVLTFRFDNIQLPARRQDDLGSNGFIQFSVQPKASLAPKTSIENYADIFFDFNEPVRTNTTLNRIFDMPPTVAPAQQLAAQQVIVSPIIQSFSPAQGRVGTLVTLTGQHFNPVPGSNRVLFQGIAAPVLSATATTLTVRVPAGATSTALTVITAEGSARTASDFTVFQAPTLTALSAPEGIPGSSITLTGTHFSPVASQDTVLVNGAIARVVQASATALQVEVPRGTALGAVELRTLGGQVRSAQPFAIWYPPTLTALSAAKGKAGAEVVLTGTNFADVAARNVVTFGTAPAAVLQASATQLHVRVPALAQSGAVQVRTPGGMASSLISFVFIPAPVVTSFSPAEGHAGTLVTLTGQNFLAEGRVDTVYFQGLPAVVVSASPTQLVVAAPKRVATGLISVVGAGGTGSAPAEFQVPALSPAEAIAIYPNPAAGEFTINWHQADFAVQHAQVLNALGGLVIEQDLRALTTDVVRMQLPTARPGLYLLVLQTEKGTITKRITLL